MQSCENTGVNGMYEVKEPTTTAKKPTQTEIDTCKFQVRERIIKERAYQTKDSMIGGGVWGSLFLIIFILHFPAFIRNARKEDGGE